MHFNDKTCRLCLREKRHENDINLEEISAVKQCMEALKTMFDIEVRKMIH